MNQIETSLINSEENNFSNLYPNQIVRKKLSIEWLTLSNDEKTILRAQRSKRGLKCTICGLLGYYAENCPQEHEGVYVTYLLAEDKKRKIEKEKEKALQLYNLQQQALLEAEAKNIEEEEIDYEEREEEEGVEEEIKNNNKINGDTSSEKEEEGKKLEEEDDQEIFNNLDQLNYSNPNSLYESSIPSLITANESEEIKNDENNKLLSSSLPLSSNSSLSSSKTFYWGEKKMNKVKIERKKRLNLKPINFNENFFYNFTEYNNLIYTKNYAELNLKQIIYFLINKVKYLLNRHIKYLENKKNLNLFISPYNNNTSSSSLTYSKKKDSKDDKKLNSNNGKKKGENNIEDNDDDDLDDNKEDEEIMLSNFNKELEKFNLDYRDFYLKKYKNNEKLFLRNYNINLNMNDDFLTFLFRNNTKKNSSTNSSTNSNLSSHLIDNYSKIYNKNHSKVSSTVINTSFNTSLKSSSSSLVNISPSFQENKEIIKYNKLKAKNSLWLENNKNYYENITSNYEKLILILDFEILKEINNEKLIIENSLSKIDTSHKNEEDKLANENLKKIKYSKLIKIYHERIESFEFLFLLLKKFNIINSIEESNFLLNSLKLWESNLKNNFLFFNKQIKNNNKNKKIDKNIEKYENIEEKNKVLLLKNEEIKKAFENSEQNDDGNHDNDDDNDDVELDDKNEKNGHDEIFSTLLNLGGDVNKSYINYLKSEKLKQEKDNNLLFQTDLKDDNKNIIKNVLEDEYEDDDDENSLKEKIDKNKKLVLLNNITKKDKSLNKKDLIAESTNPYYQDLNFLIQIKKKKEKIFHLSKRDYNPNILLKKQKEEKLLEDLNQVNNSFISSQQTENKEDEDDEEENNNEKEYINPLESNIQLPSLKKLLKESKKLNDEIELKEQKRKEIEDLINKTKSSSSSDSSKPVYTNETKRLNSKIKEYENNQKNIEAFK